VDYFKEIAHLENPLYIYVDDSLKSKILELRNENPTYFIDADPYKDFDSLYLEIKRIQESDYFKNLVPEHLKNNPEYWSPDYVFATLLKPYFVKLAIEQFEIKEQLVSWIDFGYKRNSDFIGNYLSLCFPEDKITVFSQKEISNPDVKFCVLNNDIYIIGSPVIASKENWKVLATLYDESVKDLFGIGLVDDDQGIWLMSYLKNPNLFNVIVTKEWFSLFKYNTSHIIT
jgi:protein YibB